MRTSHHHRPYLSCHHRLQPCDCLISSLKRFRS
jgi:hypothetical protein